MIYLLDINLTVALAWPNHASHQASLNWVWKKEKSGKLEIATCPMVELGFIRISMQIYGSDFETAKELLEKLVSRPQFKHHFLSETFPAIALLRKHSSAIQDHKQLNDFFLAELAASKKMKIATLDSGITHPAVERISGT